MSLGGGVKSAVAVLAAVMLLGGCSRQVEIADPLDPAVTAEIRRIKDLHLASTDPAWPAAECDIVIYRIDEDSTYGWEHCRVVGSETESAWSTPFAVRGEEIWHPQDGSEYASSLQERFPADLAEAVLERDLPTLP
ncbi:MAG TPA: hypothetical protein GXZ60_05525 [Intrasporangiaceae bacterium]|nr:hypothetical protein [Intrasporangiaceae bacterium]